MRSLFGVSQDALLLGVLALALSVALVLAWAVMRNPLLGKLAWRNMPRRPGFAVLITLGLTIGTVILSSAFTTGDTMSQSVRTVLAGVLGSADEVLFIPSPMQRSGWDLAQSIASGSLLTGVVTYFPQGDVEQVRDLLRDDDRVAAIVPVVLELTPVASESHGFSAQINLLGVPPDTPGQVGELFDSASGARLRLTDLPEGEVYVNTEVASALGVTAGDTLHAYNLPNTDNGEAFWTIKAVTRLGDVGGGQATIFLPLDRLQALLGRADQVNQVLVINRGDPDQRLAASWPITVKLRSAFLDEQTTRRLYRAMASPPAREVLGRALASRDTAPRLSDKLRRLQATFAEGAPSDEFKALAQDPEVLARLASRLPNVVSRGNTPFAAAVAGASGFRVIDVQGVAQDQADRWGSAFTDLFVVLGAFSLFSGMLLIVLVFSLVALERRAELGISRALGARRRDVVLMLALEGGMYSLISSVFGLAAGLALALGIIGLAQGLVEQYGFHLEPVVEPGSLAASYGLGVVLTFVAVTATAWRSSRFSIVTAIRDLPDPPPGLPRWRSLVFSAAPLVGGLLLVASGIQNRLSLAYAGGVALSIVGAALMLGWGLRRLGWRGPERVVFTLAGVALIVWWALPLALFPPFVEMSFLGGVSMLLGAVWVIAYNVGLLRGRRTSLPLWRLSTAYVAANRFRTGLTLAMFALVVLSLTLSAVMLTATRDAYADPEAATGGWDIRVDTTSPPRDLRADLAAGGVVSPDALAIGAGSALRVDALQPDAASARWQPATLTVIDEEFARAARAPLVAGPSDAWLALAQPGTAIVGAGLLQPAANRLRLRASEGRAFEPVMLWLRDTRETRQAVRVDVVGLADSRGPFGNTIVVGASTLAGWAPPERGSYFLSVPVGANARELAAAVALSAPDLQARTIGDDLRLVQGVRGLLSMILQGFMGVGLLAGVAALGTLSTRAVVERRRQIGILRSLGFTARGVSLGLLAEALMIAFLGAVLGVAIGLYVARNTIAFLVRQSPELRFSIPWEQLGVIVLIAVGAALLMTVLPARQAGRLTPAEALRAE
ncbi:MAG TPA: FtsX-like permease family protein [Chloroflexota bacterium]|nr:FtsX-like permease family protein [Chloroflexota bacterium]